MSTRPACLRDSYPEAHRVVDAIQRADGRSCLVALPSSIDHHRAEPDHGDLEDFVTDDSTVTEADEAFRVALDHAWAWFSMHSNQRMQLINFFIASTAFVTAGYATCVAAHQYIVAVGVAIAGLAVCIAFEMLDVRTRELVHVAEPALAALEARLIRQTQLPELNLVENVSEPERKTISYRTVLRGITRAAGFLFIAGAVYAASHA